MSHVWWVSAAAFSVPTVSFAWLRGEHLSSSSDRAVVQVVAAPVVGKLAQVGTDRTIGTVLGGVSGFGAYFGYKCTPRESSY